jgi:fructoselysine 6-kinase
MIVDTTGADDSFIAGYLYGLVQGASTALCLAAGHKQAALTCQHLGGFPQSPEPL